MCMEDGKVKFERGDDKTVMKWIKNNFGVIIFLATVIWWFASANERLFTTSEIRVETENHVVNKDVHQPYKEKLIEWYTRPEGEKLETELELLKKENKLLLQQILREVRKGNK